MIATGVVLLLVHLLVQVQAVTPRSTPANAPFLFPAIGVCLSGLEWGSVFPGKEGMDYFAPTPSEYLYFHSQGLNLIRLPFAWERLQPILSGPLDADYLTTLIAQVDIAASLNMTVLLDCHNYARFKGKLINDTGSATIEDFADLWRRTATVFKGKSGVHGFDIMNEPNSFAQGRLDVWPVIAQAAINAIREVDKDVALHVEGNQWSGANNWTALNPGFPLTDPSNNIVYSAHLYIDRDGSGSHVNWTEEAAHGVTIYTGVQRLQSFVTWLKAHNQKGHIGETGIGDDNQNWFIALDLLLAQMSANNLQFTYWSGGSHWSDYTMGVDLVTVQGRPQPRRQMSVLNKWVSAPSPTSVAAWLDGPAKSALGRGAQFTLDVRGHIVSPVRFSCYDGVNAQAFVTLNTTTEFNALFNFVFTPTVARVYQIYCVASNPTYINAPSISIEVSTSLDATAY